MEIRDGITAETESMSKNDFSRRDVSHREVVLASRRFGGFLATPQEPTGIVLFAHGSGSSRFSQRNAMVAKRLNEANIATLLFDLLTEGESADRRKVFDIELLAARLSEATEWTREHTEFAALPIGYFGASTGAGAALAAAASDNARIDAIVSRGGRPDLAGDEALRDVRAPTLLIVGSKDTQVLELNRQALERLGCEARLEIVPGATHLFEEAGALERAADLAAGWFARHFYKAAG